MPFPSEHGLRLLDPSTEHIRVTRTKGGKLVHGVKIPESVSIIWYIQERDGEEVAIPQSLRFPIRAWSEERVEQWIEDNNMEGMFEPAAPAEAEDKSYMSNSVNVLDLTIHNQIGGFRGITSESVKAKLKGEYSTIMLDINSPGGSVFEGMAIFNALKQHPAKVHGKVTGVCASICSVILMACDTIEMTKNSMLMIHMPTIDTNGTASDLRREADLLDKMKDNIVAAYKSKLKIAVDVDEMLEKETWLSPGEAKDMGLCDIITDTSPEIVNYFDFSEYRYKNTPELVMNLYDINANQDLPDKTRDKEPGEFEKLVNKLKSIFITKKESEMTTENKVKNEMDKETVENQETEEEVVNQDEEVMKRLELLMAENAALKEEVATLKRQMEEAAQEVVEDEYKEYVDSLIGKGKIRPADSDIHVENLVSRHKDEGKLSKYKDMLENLPVAFEIGQHFAHKDKAAEKLTEDQVMEKARDLKKKYEAEGKKTSLGICYKEVLNKA